jgi:hypothetical protein
MGPWLVSDPRAPAAVFGLTVPTLGRYVREAEIEVGVVDGEGWMGVPLHGVVGQECSIDQAIGLVQGLVDGAKDLSTIPPHADMTATAFRAPHALPREWAHLVYVPVDGLRLDVALVVQVQHEEQTFQSSLR